MSGTTRSRRSVQSDKSAKSSNFNCIEGVVDFGTVLFTMARKFECPVNVVVNQDFLPDEPKFGKIKSVRPIFATTVAARFSPDVVDKDSPKSAEDAQKQPKEINKDIKVNAIYSFDGRLMELSIRKYKCQPIPRVFFQVLAIILSSYSKVSKFSITYSRINKYTILELRNILSVTNITDVSLDSTNLPELNYAVLLQQVTSLQNLSLSRCRINDDVCEHIFLELHHSQPGSTMLLTLNLSINFITDVGAKSIGEALRSNRRLRYLNLADNQITDDGARYIFDALKEFPLNFDEIYDKRKRYMEFLRKEKELKCINVFVTRSNPSLTQLSNGNKMSATSLKSTNSLKKVPFVIPEDNVNARFMNLNLIERFNHPFCKSQVKAKYGQCYSKGNLILCCLNLAYNELMFSSVLTLLEVLESQQSNITDNMCGLMRIILEGNIIPSYCSEMKKINDLLNIRTRRSGAEFVVDESRGRRRSKKKSG